MIHGYENEFELQTIKTSVAPRSGVCHRGKCVSHRLFAFLMWTLLGAMPKDGVRQAL